MVRVRWRRGGRGVVRTRLAARAARRFSSFFSSASSFRKRFDSPKASAAANSPPYSRARVAASSWLGWAVRVRVGVRARVRVRVRVRVRLGLALGLALGFGFGFGVGLGLG